MAVPYDHTGRGRARHADRRWAWGEGEAMVRDSIGSAIADTLPPRWTAEAPTEPGWYWWRNPDYPPSVESPWMRLVRSHRGVVVCDEPFTRDVKVMGGEWAGPLCPPSP